MIHLFPNGTTPRSHQEQHTVSVPCDANERAVFKSYDASTKTFTIRAVPSSLPAQTQFVTYSYGVIPVVGDEYVSDADTTFKKKKATSYIIYED